MPKDPGARIVSQKVVFDGWYTFYLMMVEMPDGAVVEHRGAALRSGPSHRDADHPASAGRAVSR
jgi:hypothetical protein